MQDKFFALRRFAVPRFLVFLFLIVNILLVSCQTQTTNTVNNTLRTDSIIDSAGKFLNRALLKQSLHFVDSSYNAFNDAGPDDLWKKYSFLKNFYINYKFDARKARLYADSMSLVIRGMDDLKVEHAYTYFAHADVLMAEKKYAEAFEQYYNGRDYARRNLDSCMLASFSNQLGLVKYRQVRFREAIPYIKQAIRENAYCSDSTSFENMFYLPQNMLNTLALCYEQLNNPDSAIYYYHRNLAFIASRTHLFPKKKMDFEKASGVTFGNLGGVYANVQKFDSARYYLTQSISINDRPGYEINDAVTAKIKLAYLYIKFRKFAEAENEIKNITKHIAGLDLVSWDADILKLNLYKLVWTYHDKINNIPQAYQSQKRFYTYSDSLKKAENGMRTADMDGAFTMFKQDYQLSLLKKDDQFKTFYLIACSVFILMAGGMLAIVWKNLKRSRKVNANIAAQNEQINKQNGDMQQALSALEQSQADNTRMMKIVAHDLRNPIGGIKMAASLISRKLSERGEDFQMLDIIKRSADSALTLVEEILMINTTTEELKYESVDLGDLIGYCVTQLRDKAEAKDQQLVTRIHPITLQVNSEKIWRVISNTIANAIKFSPAKSIITIRLERKKQNALIAVHDRGIGIPDDMKDKIFDFFTEAKRKGTAGEQPFGLGMAISKQIVEAHGGKIWFKSEEGTGTTFYVELPIREV